MNKGQWFARVLMGAGADYRLGLALALTGNERYGRLAAGMLVSSSGVLVYPTASQRSGAQGSNG
ncbi:MAG TPA: hypothetical protein VMZ71_02255 [Gemmataceae bacterium]|nr:hypothetical protein [Gemmataceae bacterium]